MRKGWPHRSRSLHSSRYARLHELTKNGGPSVSSHVAAPLVHNQGHNGLLHGETLGSGPLALPPFICAISP